MTKTSAPCRLLRMVKIYATAVGPSSNKKAPNTHIRPRIHIWAMAVTVKALQRDKWDKTWWSVKVKHTESDKKISQG